jgi:protein phosphatase 4 regulatory subunit 3
MTSLAHTFVWRFFAFFLFFPTEPVLHLSREKANLYLYLCDLLCNLVVQHVFDTHRFVHDKKLVIRVATLLSTRDKHLKFGEFGY